MQLLYIDFAFIVLRVLWGVGIYIPWSINRTGFIFIFTQRPFTLTTTIAKIFQCNVAFWPMSISWGCSNTLVTFCAQKSIGTTVLKIGPFQDSLFTSVEIQKELCVLILLWMHEVCYTSLHSEPASALSLPRWLGVKRAQLCLLDTSRSEKCHRRVAVGH